MSKIKYEDSKKTTGRCFFAKKVGVADEWKERKKKNPGAASLFYLRGQKICLFFLFFKAKSNPLPLKKYMKRRQKKKSKLSDSNSSAAAVAVASSSSSSSSSGPYETYISEIVPKIPKNRMPMAISFDSEYNPLLDTLVLPTEFVLNSGGVVLFSANPSEMPIPVPLLETMSMINELNKVNWGHPDGSTCIIVPNGVVDKAEPGFMVYRTWNLSKNVGIDRVDPIFAVANVQSAYGTLGISSNGKLADLVVRYDITKSIVESGRRLEARDIFFRGTFAELHIVVVFSDINDYASDLEDAIEPTAEIPESESTNVVTVNAKSSAVVVEKIANSGLEAPPPSPSDPTTDHPKRGRKCRKIVNVVDTNPTRMHGNYRVCLSRFLRIVQMHGLSHTIFVISDPLLLGDYVTGIRLLISSGKTYLDTIFEDDPSMPSANVEYVQKSIAVFCATRNKQKIPLKLWLQNSTAMDNVALLLSSKTGVDPENEELANKIAIALVIERMLYGSYVGINQSLEIEDMKTTEISPTEILQILKSALPDFCQFPGIEILLVQTMMHQCALHQISKSTI